jgi:hypothetical protein
MQASNGQVLESGILVKVNSMPYQFRLTFRYPWLDERQSIKLLVIAETKRN